MSRAGGVPARSSPPLPVHHTSHPDTISPTVWHIAGGSVHTKKGCHAFMAPFACSIGVKRLPAIALSATTTAATESTAAATRTLLHRFRFIDR